jgi:[ribosomal protein S18]-alanine N-acetyltransferase
METPPDPAPIIRRAGPADAQSIFDLQESLFPADINRLTLDECLALENNRHLIVLAAETADGIGGFLVMRNRSMRPWTGIDFVGVAPSVSGRGIGGKLLESASLVSPRPVLRLFVRSSNAAARALYARCGFRHTSTRKASYADGEDALVHMKWVGLKTFRHRP